MSAGLRPRRTVRVVPDETRVRRPRADVLDEVEVAPGRFEQARGPFVHYERHLADNGDGTLTETTEHRLAPMVVPPVSWLVHATIRRPAARAGRPFWAPPEAVDARAATTLGSLCVLAVALGYLGSVLTQTITYTADSFGSSTTAQGATLAAVRVGVLLAVALTALADRRGRRTVLLWAAGGACVLTAASGLVPGLVALAAVQVPLRGLTTASAVLLAVLVAEEMPAGARAYGISLLTMSGALGIGTTLWLLPLADLGPEGWRVLYGLGLLWLPVVALVARHLQESRRFAVAHVDAPMAGHGHRFWLLALSALLVNLFTAPASQLMNEFLREERSFSAAQISLFTILTNTPGGLGILIGGRIADVRGRRVVGAVGVAGGALLTVAMVLTQGWPMWALSVAGAVVGALTIPALGVYGPELFPTGLRSRANGVISVLGVVGSAIGLLTAGALADRWGDLGPALAVLAVGPLAMALLVLLAYPETAHRELEEINPEDAGLAGTGPASPPVA